MLEKKRKIFFVSPDAIVGPKERCWEEGKIQFVFSRGGSAVWALTQGGGTSQKERRREDAHTREGISTISQVCTLVAYITIIREKNCKLNLILKKAEMQKKLFLDIGDFQAWKKRSFKDGPSFLPSFLPPLAASSSSLPFSSSPFLLSPSLLFFPASSHLHN